jgi:DnaK suppressor protein
MASKQKEKEVKRDRTAKKQKDEKREGYEEIRQDLEKQKEAILADAGVVIGSGLSSANENLSDLSDQATAETDQNFFIRLREREQRLLKKIDEAIDRINAGTFGICESCGGEISLKRLKARPVTTLCIDCKTKQEAEEKIRQ